MIRALQNKKPAKSFKGNKRGGKVREDKHSSKEQSLKKILKKLKVKDETVIFNAIKNISAGHSIGFNKSLGELYDIPTGELFDKIKNFKDTQFLIIDGILTKRLLTLSIKMKIKFIACKNKEDKMRVPENLIVYFY